MPVVERAEAPVLSLEHAAICLHYVEGEIEPAAKALPYPDCPVLRSMELDLLSYRFQLDPPMGSQCESHGRLPIELLFPEHLEYHSEGRAVTLTCSSPRRAADLILSSTTFLRSGVRVWHAVITPRPGGRFTEFDLIKLIHLYDGRTEATRLAEEVRFVLADGRQVGAEALPHAAHSRAPAGLRLRAGTLQVLAADPISAAETLPDLVALAAAVPEGAEAPDAVAGWLAADDPRGRALQAFSGVVSGIFDFDHMDADELRDTLEPTVPEADGLIRIQRGTLTALSRSDRAMEECADSVGISPYLIIPHAALLHNEALVDAADTELDEALADPRGTLRSLEAAHARADLLLNRFYLPSVFNYRSERVLFLRGAEERGSDERRAAAAAKLAELDSRMSRQWEDRRDRGQMYIGVLLAVISVLQLKDMIFGLVGSEASDAARWGTLGAAAAAMALLILFFWRLGVRR
jgi:hypothetical protein